MTTRLYHETFQIILEDVPAIAELECGQFASAGHSVDLLAAALEYLRYVTNV